MQYFSTFTKYTFKNTFFFLHKSSLLFKMVCDNFDPQQKARFRQASLAFLVWMSVILEIVVVVINQRELTKCFLQ
jgi:hypothetical protein